jgi:hypothetical protein
VAASGSDTEVPTRPDRAVHRAAGQEAVVIAIGLLMLGIVVFGAWSTLDPKAINLCLACVIVLPFAIVLAVVL